MHKSHKQINIILLFKFLILSFIFCLPKIPTATLSDNIISLQKKSSSYSFILPSNAHFEIKVLKKIPQTEAPAAIFSETFSLKTYTSLAIFSPSSFILIKTSHFRSSSYPRGPPLYS